MVRVERPGTALGANSGMEPVTRQPTPPPVDRTSSINEINRDQLESAVDISNKAMEVSNFSLKFKIHEDSGRVQVKVVDTETKEVIREVPPEQMLEIAAQISDMLKNLHQMVGVLVNELV
jgi:flagellar protein FlaG